MRHTVLVTGSCGFIGSNLVERLCSDGIKVVGVDDLCRNGSEYNLQSLSRFSNFVHHKVNVSDRNVLSDIFQKDGPFDAIYHLAAQVAVTTSYVDPGADFRVNAQGSFNVIECAHRFSPKAYCLYASTNKVYGHLIVDEPVGMQHNLDPYTPYGVSKAVGELYFREFGRDEFGLETCCLRQSCIYGDRQFGVEDQGWVAWFMAANLLGMPVTVYGDGQQVRDLLYITDLIDLYQLAWRERLVGSYPVGGGATNAISVKAALNLIETVTGQKFASKGHGPARAGDQPYFVADNSWASDLKLGWQPQISVEVGMRRLNNSLRSRTDQLKKIFAK